MEIEETNQLDQSPVADQEPLKKKNRGKLGENKLESISLSSENLEKVKSVLDVIPPEKNINNATRLFVYLMDAFFEGHTLQVMFNKLEHNNKALAEKLQAANDLLQKKESITHVPTPTVVSVNPTTAPKTKAQNLLFPHL